MTIMTTINNEFDTFPSKLDRKWCIEEMTKNQINIMRETRQQFTNLIKECVKNCEPTVTLTFPKRLWSSNRVKIALELINHFGEVKMCSLQNSSILTKIGASKDEIPQTIESLTIMFTLDNFK